MVKKVRTDLLLLGSHSYADIKNVSYDGKVLYFEHENIAYQTSYPFIQRTVVTLSCGHNPSNYWEEDAGNAGCWDRCRECDKVQEKS